jgi:hypothetical protein
MTSPIADRDAAAEKWLVDNDWDYQKYGDKRPDRSAYDTLMKYEISDCLSSAFADGWDACLAHEKKLAAPAIANALGAMYRQMFSDEACDRAFNEDMADAIKSLESLTGEAEARGAGKV